MTAVLNRPRLGEGCPVKPLNGDSRCAAEPGEDPGLESERADSWLNNII